MWLLSVIVFIVLFCCIVGHLGRTFTKSQKAVESSFAATNENAAGKTIIGINENDNDYKHGRWCFDTPGVVQPDQVNK